MVSLVGLRRPPAFTTEVHQFAYTTSWVVPATGRWQFVLRGKGGQALGALDVEKAGGSGALAIKTALLKKGQTVSVSLTSGSTSITLPNGLVVTAGAGQDGNDALGAGGVATNGDINLNGSAGVHTVGAPAPSYLGFVGGLANSGQPGVGHSSNTPGGPAAAMAFYLGE